MAFQGTPLVTLVADGLVRISNDPEDEVAFGVGAEGGGTITLFEGSPAGDIVLPAAFRPRDYDRSTTTPVVALQDSVQVEITQTNTGTLAVPIVVVKTGTTPANFSIAVSNPTLGGAVLGGEGSFAVLAGSTATNTNNTVVTGDLGVSPGAAITGFPPGTVSGTQHSADAAAANAQLAATAAYIQLAALTPTQNLTGIDLGTLTLPPGVYKFNTSAQLTGTLTLVGAGIYVFQIGSTLTTASASVVSLTGGATAGNVYWQVGSSATLGTTTEMRGNIIALTAITMNTNANIIGRVWARNAAVTMDDNNIDTTGAGGTGVTADIGDMYIRFH